MKRKTKFILITGLLGGLFVLSSNAHHDPHVTEYFERLVEKDIQFIGLVEERRILIADDTNPIEACRIANTEFPDAEIISVRRMHDKSEIKCSEVK